MYKIITITGDLGSGKSAVSHLIASQCAMRRYSAGDAQRKIAMDLGLTTVELNLRAEQDPTIDQRIDAVFKDFAHTQEPMIIDSRMAWHFLPQSFKVRLRVFSQIAARRVFADLQRGTERYSSVEEAAIELQRRRRSEVSRFKVKYNVDIGVNDPFDLVVDTTLNAPEEIAGLIIETAKAFWLGQPVDKTWVCPRLLFPTRALNSTSKEAAQVRSSVAMRGFDPGCPIQVLEKDEFSFIYDGHQRTSAALFNKTVFVPISTLRQSEVDVGMSVAEYLRNHCSMAIIHEWETTHGFRFHAYPAEFGPQA